MNYIVFVNKKGSEKLAICTNVNTFYDIDVNFCNSINKICDDNDYCFLIKHNIKNKTPKIDASIIK